MLKMSSVRNWGFTLNNPKEEEIKTLHAWTNEVNKIVVSKEVGEEKGTLHLQGQITFKRTYRLLALKKLLPRANWKPYKTNDALYEKKATGELIIDVDNRKQGSRTDLKRLRDDVMCGETSSKKILLEGDPMVYHQYGRTIEKIQELKAAQTWRTWETKGLWYWGATGTGKSKKAYEGYHPDTHYVWSKGEVLQNYDGQETVIFDEIRARDFPYDFWLNVVNGHPFTVPIKGGKPRQFLAKTVIVTAPVPPQEMYPNQDGRDHISQLLRRFKVTEFKLLKKTDDSVGFMD